MKTAFTLHREEVKVGVVRKPKEDGSQQQFTVELPPRPIKHLDVVMEMGPVTALQAGSPAEAAGVHVGDVLTEVDGQPVGDPLALPSRLYDKAGQTVSLTVKRGSESVRLSAKQLASFSNEASFFEGAPLAVPSLGVTYSVVNKVASVGRKAAGLTPGDEIVSVKVMPGKTPVVKDDAQDKDAGAEEKLEPFDLKMKDKDNWPLLFYALQRSQPGTKVELTLASGKSVTLEPVVDDKWFNADRGFSFEPDFYIRKAEGLGDDLALAARETRESVTQVYGFLGQLGSGRISAKNLGGPITIATMAGASAQAGISELLRFLVMLSANLAVLNFLPIPLLDGGHVVFLMLEWIRGKPVSEKVVLAFHYAGFAFIIGLMIFVFSLDIMRTWFS